MDKGLVFIVGGARSGKSAHALSLAQGCPALKKVYIATAQALDAEMASRIEAHRLERSDVWDTVEEPIEVAGTVGSLGAGHVILVDCLTLWLSNLLQKELPDDGIREKIDSLVEACKSSPSTVIAVSNEVGLGLVPDNALARRFRDLSGWMNQRAAASAKEAWFVASGIPLRLK